MPIPEFLKELRLQLNREYETKARLDSKSNTIIAIAGTVVSLLAGFGGILISKIDPLYEFINYIILVFILGVILIISTIILALIAHLLRNYVDPLGADEFFKSGKEEPDEDMIDKFLNATPEIFNKRMAIEYLFCIKKNTESNKIKGKYVSISHVIFIVGILSIIPLVSLLIHAFMTSSLSPILN